MNGKTVTASENGQTVLVVQSGIVTVTGDLRRYILHRA